MGTHIVDRMALICHPAERDRQILQDMPLLTLPYPFGGVMDTVGVTSHDAVPVAAPQDVVAESAPMEPLLLRGQHHVHTGLDEKDAVGPCEVDGEDLVASLVKRAGDIRRPQQLPGRHLQHLAAAEFFLRSKLLHHRLGDDAVAVRIPHLRRCRQTQQQRRGQNKLISHAPNHPSGKAEPEGRSSCRGCRRTNS